MLKVLELFHFSPPPPQPSVLCAANHSPRAGAERLRGRGPMEQRLVRSAGSWGPAGGVMGSVIVPAVWIGQERGPKDGARNPGIKKKEGGKGRGHLNYLCSLWPLSPPASPRTDLLFEGRGTFPQADAQPPPLFQTAFAPFSKRREFNCNNLPSDVSLLYFHCRKISIFLKNIKWKADFSAAYLCLIRERGHAISD